MTVNVNGKPTATEAATLSQLITQLGLPSEGVAVAVDNRIVRRTEWDAFSLAEGANVVIIKAACGG